MIIWRGWGFLAVVYMGVLAALLGGLLGAAVLQQPDLTGALAGVGISLGGVLTYIQGRHLNATLPKQRAEEWAAGERPRLEAAADQGRLVVGNVAPRSREEAQAMVEDVLARGRAQIGAHGQHSVFWIPMEAVGILGIVGGLVLVLATLVG